MARDEGGKGEIAGEGGRGGRETTLGPTVQGEAAGRERKRRRRDGTDGTSRRAHVCVCVCVSIYVCMHVHPRVYALSCVSAHICATFDHVCMDALAPVRVHGRSAWSRIRGVWCTRGEHVCASRSRANVCGCAPPVPRTSVGPCMHGVRTYVCTCARSRTLGCMCAACRRVCNPCVCTYTRVNPCVGDDALQTRVKSRGGREFLCASRPVLLLLLLLVPSPPPSAAQQPSSPRSRHPTPWSPSPSPRTLPPRAQLTAVGPFREW